MEPTATVRQRRLSFSEHLVLNRWDREEMPGFRVHVPLMLLSGLALILGLWMDGIGRWHSFVKSTVAPWFGSTSRSSVFGLTVAGLLVFLLSILVIQIFAIVALVRGLKGVGGRALLPEYRDAIEFHARHARFVASHDSSASRPWILVAVAPSRVLYFSPWTGGERHRPSPVDSLPRGKFPSEFRLVLHAWHRSILRLEPIGPLADAIGTVRTDEFPLLPDGGMTRSPRDRWALFEGDIEHPAALRRIECNSVDAIEAALAPAP